MYVYVPEIRGTHPKPPVITGVRYHSKSEDNKDLCGQCARGIQKDPVNTDTNQMDRTEQLRRYPEVETRIRVDQNRTNAPQEEEARGMYEWTLYIMCVSVQVRVCECVCGARKPQ